MERQIRNPFEDLPGYNCFGCAPYNEKGLRMTFTEDGENIRAVWEPEDHFQGYGSILHGGIAVSLMDEVAAWVVFIKLRTAGLTTALEVKYLSPAYTNRGRLIVTGRIGTQSGKTADILTRIEDADGAVCSEAVITYRIYPEQVARKKLFYPGIEAFYRGE